MPLYALGWKGFIEVRDSKRKPLAQHSQVSHRTGPGPEYWQKPRAIKLKQLCFKGGQFMVSLDKSTFHTLTKLTVPVGAVLLIPAKLRETLAGVRDGQFAPQTTEQTPHPVAAPASMRPTRTTRRRRPHEGARNDDPPETEGLTP